MDNKGSCSTDKNACAPSKCCWLTIFKGALVGAIVMFVVYWTSWMVLPFHMKNLHAFSNEGAVAAVLQHNAAKDGVYILPGMKSEAAKAAIKAGGVAKPFAFVT